MQDIKRLTPKSMKVLAVIEADLKAVEWVAAEAGVSPRYARQCLPLLHEIGLVTWDTLYCPCCEERGNVRLTANGRRCMLALKVALYRGEQSRSDRGRQ